MIGRCQSNPRYKALGVCKRWKTFKNFLEDMGERPSKLHSIERIKNEVGYRPGNCRWATKAEQNRNTRSNRRITINGRTMILADWITEFGIPVQTYFDRRKRGMDEVSALKTPRATR
jgi:hypothetical protein